jgi:hypothetical protein
VHARIAHTKGKGFAPSLQSATVLASAGESSRPSEVSWTASEGKESALWRQVQRRSEVEGMAPDCYHGNQVARRVAGEGSSLVLSMKMTNHACAAKTCLTSGTLRRL